MSSATESRCDLLHGLSSSKHTGVRSLFNQHFVRTDRVPRALAQIYNDLFARCVEGDYVDFVRFEAVQVQPWMEDAEAFVGAIFRPCWSAWSCRLAH